MPSQKETIVSFWHGKRRGEAIHSRRNEPFPGELVVSARSSVAGTTVAFGRLGILGIHVHSARPARAARLRKFFHFGAKEKRPWLVTVLRFARVLRLRWWNCWS
jgi:hypothetical protein